jgi:uncharacterized protein YjbI with pentapeptide repeats
LCIGNGLFFFTPSDFVYAYHSDHLEDLKDQIARKKDINCVGYHLENADLSDLNLKRANFSRSYLSGANFTNSNLSKANFKFADMTTTNLTKAVVNGAQFRGAHLGGIQYDQISAKGTFFADSSVFSEKMSYENKIQKIAEEFLRGTQASVNLKNVSQIKYAHNLLYTHLSNNDPTKIDHMIFDFRSVKLEKEELITFYQECLYFLKTPLFRQYTPNVLPICDNQAILCFFSDKTSNPKKREDPKLLVLKPLYLELPVLNPIKKLGNPGKSDSAQDSSKITNSPVGHFLALDTLDLHGKFPIHLKFQWVSKFIQMSYDKNRPYIYIITGRGLHNPEGKMGVFWKLCKRYLNREKFHDYIKEIIPVSKNGGWKVVLKEKRKTSKKFSYCNWKNSSEYAQKKHRKFSYNKGVIPFRNEYKTIIINKKSRRGNPIMLKNGDPVKKEIALSSKKKNFSHPKRKKRSREKPGVPVELLN